MSKRRAVMMMPYHLVFIRPPPQSRNLNLGRGTPAVRRPRKKKDLNKNKNKNRLRHGSSTAFFFWDVTENTWLGDDNHTETPRASSSLTRRTTVVRVYHSVRSPRSASSRSTVFFFAEETKKNCNWNCDTCFDFYSFFTCQQKCCCGVVVARMSFFATIVRGRRYLSGRERYYGLLWCVHAHGPWNDGRDCIYFSTRPRGRMTT